MGTYTSNYVKTHDPAGYPLAESEDIISGTEFYKKPVLGGQANIYEPIEDIEVVSEVVEAAAKRKAQPVFSGVLSYFPNAIKYVSTVSKAGNDQHHPDKPLHWDKSKSSDETDALTRHLIDHSIDPMDTDGMLHLGKVAWRALAALERYLDTQKL